MPVTENRLYLYAIVAGGVAPREPLVGLADAPVSLLHHDAILAAVSDIDTARLEPMPEQLLRHEQVVESLMGLGSVLPVRFGTVLSSAQRLHDVLASSYATLSADLERLAGQIEIGLRLLWDVDAIQPGDGDGCVQPGGVQVGDGSAGPGSTYLLARVLERSRERFLTERAQALDAWCRGRLGGLCSELSTRVLVTPALPVSAALLLPRERLDTLLTEVGRMQSDYPGLDMVCTGPWPPYHFVSEAVSHPVTECMGRCGDSAASADL
jgi:hypothetical protein